MKDLKRTDLRFTDDTTGIDVKVEEQPPLVGPLTHSTVTIICDEDKPGQHTCRLYEKYRGEDHERVDNVENIIVSEDAADEVTSYSQALGETIVRWEERGESRRIQFPECGVLDGDTIVCRK